MKLPRQWITPMRRVTASVSDFIPKPHTPYQWDPMETEASLRETHHYLRQRPKLGAVSVKCHDLSASKASADSMVV